MLPDKLRSIFISMILFSLVNLNLALSLVKLSSKLSWVVFTCFDKAVTSSISSISNNTKMKLLLYLLYYLTLCSTIFFYLGLLRRDFSFLRFLKLLSLNAPCILLFYLMLDLSTHFLLGSRSVFQADVIKCLTRYFAMS